MTTIIKQLKKLPEGIAPEKSVGTQVPVYDNHQEIFDKIQRSDPMTGSEKYLLQYNINELLSKEDHIEILKLVIKNTNKKIYTANKTSTFFDLGDLSNSTLWKLYYYVTFSLTDMSQKNALDKLYEESDIERLKFKQRIQEELEKKLATGEVSPPDPVDTKNRLYAFDTVPSYETLRNQALYNATPVHTEQIKITQMQQLNKLKDLDVKATRKNPKKIPAKSFFHSYTSKQENPVTDTQPIVPGSTADDTNENNVDENDANDDDENAENADNDDENDEDADNNDVENNDENDSTFSDSLEVEADGTDEPPEIPILKRVYKLNVDDGMIGDLEEEELEEMEDEIANQEEYLEDGVEEDQ